MVWHPEDALDAFTTWVHRVAANYLLTAKRSRLQARTLSSDAFAADLKDGLDLAAPRRDAPESIAILADIKVGCTLAMRSCLDRPHRLA